VRATRERKQAREQASKTTTHTRTHPLICSLPPLLSNAAPHVCVCARLKSVCVCVCMHGGMRRFWIHTHAYTLLDTPQSYRLFENPPCF